MERAIFDKDGRMVTLDWYEYVSKGGLVLGQSQYYIAKKGRKYAIFDKDGNQISEWYDRIEEDGLVKGESDYYVVKKNDKWAIFHKDGKMVS